MATTEKNYIVSGGMGFLKIYNLDGKEISNLVGHTGVIWSIALDGDRLVSGSSDQTIRIWDLSKLKRQMQPQLSLFISKTNDWIAWTPQGFYNASKGGEKYIGYHLNHGAEYEAEFVTIEKFQAFHRADLIVKALEGEDLTRYANAINIEKLLLAGLPPKVEIVNPVGEFNNPTNRGQYRVDVEVCGANLGELEITLYRNGTAIANIDKESRAFKSRKMGKRGCTIMNKTISLESGDNTIEVKATTPEEVDSNVDVREVRHDGSAEALSNLHILTLSVNNYQDRSLTLTYANNDAEAMVREIARIGKPMFNHVYAYELKDSQVTQANMVKKFKEIGEVVQKDDVFVLFIAGHGDLDETTAKYYFIPYDCPNGAELSRHAISQMTLLKALSNIETRKSVVLLDTCKSGGFINKELEIQVLKKIKERSGRAILSASSKTQYANEGFNGHGAFTSTLLDGIKNREVYGYDHKLTITELADYVQTELPIKTERKNHLQNAIFFKDNNNVKIWIGEER